jgi:hypothetical protein
MNACRLLQNLCGLKDAGKTWHGFLKKGLIERDWKTSEVGSCLFTKNKIILIVYVDEAILILPNKKLIDTEIKSLQKGYDLTHDGELKDYLGTRFEKKPDGSNELTQPKMIDRVLRVVGLYP